MRLLRAWWSMQIRHDLGMYMFFSEAHTGQWPNNYKILQYKKRRFSVALMKLCLSWVKLGKNEVMFTLTPQLINAWVNVQQSALLFSVAAKYFDDWETTPLKLEKKNFVWSVSRIVWFQKNEKLGRITCNKVDDIEINQPCVDDWKEILLTACYIPRTMMFRYFCFVF